MGHFADPHTAQLSGQLLIIIIKGYGCQRELNNSIKIPVPELLCCGEGAIWYLNRSVDNNFIQKHNNITHTLFARQGN